MANNVLFKKGLQAALPTTGAVENGFYLTTDTHRLYIGSNGTTALLNSAVAFYANEAALAAATNQFKPAEGDIAFVNDINALCVYKDFGATANPRYGWIQVNVDTDTDTSLYNAVFDDGEKIEIGEGDNKKNAIKYVLTVKEQDKDGVVVKNNDGSDKTTTAELIITEDMVTSLVVDVKVGLDAQITDNKAIISTVGAGSDTNNKITVVGEDGITIKGTEDNIIIDGTTYELELEDGTTTIQLRNSNDTGDDSKDIDGAVEFVDDGKWIEVSNDNGKIKVAHNGNDSATKTSGTATRLEDESKFEVVTGLTIEKGHVTGYQTTEYTIQDTITTVDGSIEVKDEIKQLKLDTKNESGAVIATDHVDISSKLNVNGTEYVIQPTGEITLPSYYTKEEVDAQHRAINAMVYKGVINGDSDLPTAEDKPEIGWTYKVATKGTYAGIECNVGDLLIANGTETNGVLTSITWDHIDISDFEDTTYDLQVKNNEIILHNNVTLDDDKIVVEDDDIVVLEAKQVTDEKGKVIDKLIGSHKAISIEKPTASEEELAHGEAFTVITGLVDDGYGHITKINTTEFTLPASGDTIEADADEVKLTFKDVDGVVQGSIDLDDDDVIVVEGASTDNKNLVATVKHAKVTKNNTTGTANPAHEAGFTVVEAVTYNDYGHVTGVKTTTVTLPKETTYEIDGPAAITNGVEYVLKNDAGDECGDKIDIVSTSLSITAVNNQTSVELVWGEF